MKKIALSALTILALSHEAYAGGEITPPVEPSVEAPVAIDN